MTYTNRPKISSKFQQVLQSLNNHHITRNQLIELTANRLNLHKKQALGVVNQGILQLKMQGLVTRNYDENGLNYTFSPALMSMIKGRTCNKNHSILTDYKATLEKSLVLTGYELQAYDELIDKIPRAKIPILRLKNLAKVKMNIINGKLRAVEKVLRVL